MGTSRTCGIALLCGLGLLTLLTPAEAQEEKEPDPQRAMILRKVLLILRESDSFKACEFVNSLGDSSVVAQRYSDLLRDFYWQQRDVPRMVMFGRAGIQYCLRQAAACAKDEPDKAKKLLGAAKAIAYNLAANTWPGWKDEEITLTASDLAAGLDAARLNLRLANELGREGEVLGNAHWVLGAHYLAAEEGPQALEAFAAAADKFRQAKKPAHATMAVGYQGIANMTRPPTRDEGQKQFDESLAALKEMDTDEAKFFAEQLETAAKVLLK